MFAFCLEPKLMAAGPCSSLPCDLVCHSDPASGVRKLTLSGLIQFLENMFDAKLHKVQSQSIDKLRIVGL